LVRHAETIRYWRILLNKPKIGARRKPAILRFERMLPFDAIPTLLHLARHLNDQPGKCLGYKSTAEVFMAKLQEEL
jgi:hypothetical protein